MIFMNSGNIQKYAHAEQVKGFTLIETIVALSVSLIVIFGMTNVFISGIRHIHAVKADTLLSTNVSYMLQTLGYEIHRAKRCHHNKCNSSYH